MLMWDTHPLSMIDETPFKKGRPLRISKSVCLSKLPPSPLWKFFPKSIQGIQQKEMRRVDDEEWTNWRIWKKKHTKKFKMELRWCAEWDWNLSLHVWILEFIRKKI